MKKYQIFFPENLHFLVVKFSVHLNRRVFVMFVKSLHGILCQSRVCSKGLAPVTMMADLSM